MELPELPLIPEQELIDLAQFTMKEAKFPFLASMDKDQPRLRPVSPGQTHLIFN